MASLDLPGNGNLVPIDSDDDLDASWIKPENKHADKMTTKEGV